MKPYFAKWIPVEGEIKEGDGYYFSQGKLKKLDSLAIGFLTELNAHTDNKRVKLFLCSRNIPKGEKLAYCDETDGSFIKIGEISPEAIWVKGDDEFDDTEVVLSCPVIGLINVPVEHYKAVRKDTPYSILIKCPTCLKYH